MNRSKALVLFGAAGVVAALVNALAAALAGRSILSVLLFFLGPGTAFALLVASAFRVANRSRIWGHEVVVTKPNGAFSIAILVASWPVALLAILFAIQLLSPPMDSDAPPIPPTRIQNLVGNFAVELSFLVGGFVVLLLLASSARVASKKWPRKILLWSLLVAVGVPLVTIAVNTVLFSPGSFDVDVPPSLRLFVRGPVWFQPLTLLVVGQGALGLLLGYWLFEGLRVKEQSSN